MIMKTEANETAQIPGYDYGKKEAAKSPLTLEDLRRLEHAVGWTDEDARWLQRAAKTLEPKADEIVTSWRSEIARQPHLMVAFTKADGAPDDNYRSAVKRRFVQWISDICRRPHDQDWLNYQEEIGLRHMPAKKNKTDDGETPNVVPMRYTVGFAAVVITSVRAFLDADGWNKQDAQRIQEAWTRAVMLSVTLWARPFVTPGLW